MLYQSKLLAVSTLLAFGLATQTQAGIKTIADVTTKPDKVAKQVWFGPAPGQIKKLYDIGLPKRIGLITFVLSDSGTNKFSAMAATYGGTYSRSWYMGDYNANLFASDFAEISIPIIKQRFAEQGMAVLTPTEFLDTQEKIDAYFEFELPKSGLQKVSEATVAWLDQNPASAAQADGFSWIPMYASFLTQDIMGELDSFRRALGLDALMAVTINTKTTSATVGLGGVYMQLIGPNPEPRPDNEKYVKYWWPMVMYPSATFGKGFKGATFHKWETRDSEAWTSYDGFEVIIDAVSTRTTAELQKYYDKGAKKAK